MNEQIIEKVKPYKKDLIYIIIILLILCGCGYTLWRDRVNTNKLVHDLTFYTDSAHTYKNKYNEQVYFNSTLELENKTQLKTILSKDEKFAELMKKFKNIDNAVIIKEIIKTKTDTIRLTNEIPCTFNTIPLNKETKFYSLYSRLSNEMFTIDSIKLFNEQRIIIGEKRLGLFKTEKRVEIVNSNPYVIIQNIGSYDISNKKLWYQTRGFAFGSGIVAGMIATLYLKH